MMSATAKHNLAKLALGVNANDDITFYASINQNQIEQRLTSQEDKVEEQTMEGSHWDLIRTGAMDFDPALDKENYEQASNAELSKERQCNDTCVRLDQAMNTIKEKLTTSCDSQLMSGVDKFLTRFEKLSDYRSLAKLSSPIWVGNGNHNRNTGWPNKTWQENSHSTCFCWTEKNGIVTWKREDYSWPSSQEFLYTLYAST